MGKKILLIASDAQKGGAVNELIYLAAHLSEKYSPTIVVSKYGPLTDECEKRNIAYVVIKFLPFRMAVGSTKLRRIVKKILFPILFLRYIITNHIALRHISKKIDLREIYLVHTNTNRDDFGAMIAKRYNIPHIWHIREIDNVPYECYSFRLHRFEYMNNNAKKFIMISKSVAKSYAKLGLDETRMSVVYDGIEIRKDFEKTYSKNGLKIIMLGAVVEGKGQLAAVEAVNLLSNDIRNKVRIDIYGDGDAEYVKKIQNKIRAYKLNLVSVCGHKNDVYDIIQEYDVVLSCAISEGFGISTVECMSNKLIPIVTNTGASPEIVTNGTGLIYKLGNIHELAEKISKVYHWTIKEKQMWGEKAYRRTLDFTIEKNVSEIEEIYDTITG